MELISPATAKDTRRRTGSRRPREATLARRAVRQLLAARQAGDPEVAALYSRLADLHVRRHIEQLRNRGLLP